MQYSKTTATNWDDVFTKWVHNIKAIVELSFCPVWLALPVKLCKEGVINICWGSRSRTARMHPYSMMCCCLAHVSFGEEATSLRKSDWRPRCNCTGRGQDSPFFQGAYTWHAIEYGIILAAPSATRIWARMGILQVHIKAGWSCGIQESLWDPPRTIF